MEKIFDLATGTGVRPEWLLTGEEPMRPNDASAQLFHATKLAELLKTFNPDRLEALTAAIDRGDIPEDADLGAILRGDWDSKLAPANLAGDYLTLIDASRYTAIPRRDVKAAAGDKILIPGEEIVDVLLFKTEFLRRELGLDPRALVVIQARGDSMQPTIDDGDLLLVDCSQALDADNAIYVLNVNDRILVKRLHFRIDGTIEVLSDNPKYKSETVNPRNNDVFRVVGRVVWSGGRL
jgi:hypothetical protein